MSEQLVDEVYKIYEDERQYKCSGGLKDVFHGNIYQLKLLMLFMVRGLNKKYSYSLATEMHGAENFNDLIFMYENEKKNGKVYRFLQAKHTQDESNKITRGNLLSKKGDFSLKQYFISYRKMQNQIGMTQNSEYKDVIICTNINVDKKLSSSFSPRDDKDDMLDIQLDNKNPMRLKFDKDKFPSKPKLYLLLKDASELKILAEELASHVSRGSQLNLNNKLLRSYNVALAEEIIDVRNCKFHNSFVENNTQLENFRNAFLEAYDWKPKEQPNVDEFWEKMKSVKLVISKNFGKNKMFQNALPGAYCIKEEEINIFLDKLVFAVNQPNEIELDKIIKNELGEISNNLDNQNVYARFLMEAMNWMKMKEGRILSNVSASNFFDLLKNETLVNIYFNLKSPVRLFTGRENTLLDLHKTIQRSTNDTQASQITCVSGLGGIGKTEFVRKYVQKYSKNYHNNVLWINAENYESLTQSFYELAIDNRIGILTKDKDDRNKTIESIVEEIYKLFAKRKSLFIFDNAKKSDDINKFLPICPLTTGSNSLIPFILITSRSQEWESGVEVIKLVELDPVDAITFVKRGLNIVTEDQPKDKVIDLVKLFQYFPLAIQQSIAFVLEQRQGETETFEIDDFLKIYDVKKVDILDSRAFQGIENNYSETTFTTWKITIDNIQADRQYGQLALEILNIIAYISPENIHRNIFLYLTNGNEYELKCAVRLLINYSMINVEEKQSILSIHRLVQQVTRIATRQKNIEDNIVDMTFKLFKINFPYFGTKSEDYEKKRQLLPHLKVFLSHLDKRSVNNPEDRNITEKKYIVELLNWMSSAYINIGENNNAMVVLNRILEIHIALYGSEHLEVSKIQEQRAICYNKLGYPLKYMELLECSLKIKRKHYDGDNVEVAFTLDQICKAHLQLGNHEMNIKLSEQVLTMKNQFYPPNHVEVANTLDNLALSYYSMQNFHKSYELLQQSLKIKEKHYGLENIVLAPTLDRLGITYGELGMSLDDLFKRTNEIKVNFYGANHVEVAKTLFTFAEGYGTLGEYQKKKQLLEQSLKILERHYGHDHVKLCYPLESLGYAYYKLHYPVKCMEFIERSLSIKEKNYGLNHLEVAITLKKLSTVYFNLKKYEKCVETTEKIKKLKL